MLRLISTKSLLSRVNRKASTFSSHGFGFWNFSLRPMSEISKSTNPISFTVSYLQNSCGLSEKSAISASEKVWIESPEKADSFLSLLRAHGLTESHVRRLIKARPTMLLANVEGLVRPNLELFEAFGISGNRLGQMVCKEPQVLVCKPHKLIEFLRANGFTFEQITAMVVNSPRLFRNLASKNFKPKLDLLRSIGLTDEDVVRVLTSVPCILLRSLDNHLIPCIELLRQFLGSGADVVKVIKAHPIILGRNMEKVLTSNISILKSCGVSEHLISRMFVIEPKRLLFRLNRRANILDDVAKLGFDPNTLSFVKAVCAMATITKARWEQNMQAYKSFGLSIDQIHAAFRIRPAFMVVSEKKLKSSLDFLINKLNMEPSAVCSWPSMLSLSVEKTVIPRCTVVRLLRSKGLIRQDVQFTTYLKMSEKNFSENIVNKYREVLPEIVRAYEAR